MTDLTQNLVLSDRTLRIGRRVLVWGLAFAAMVYFSVFALLLWFQRDMLFVGSHAALRAMPANAIYHARSVREADGTRLTILEAVPSRAGAPTVVFFYGNGGSLWDFADVGEQLHNRDGFGVVLAAYRGYAGNSGHPSEEGLMADARAVVATIPKSNRPIVLWGQSLGTGVAARMAAEGRGVGLILQSPYTSIADVAAGRFPIYPVRWFMRDPFDTLSLVAKIKMPVLIMHGTRDNTVPFAMGLALSQDFGREAHFVAIPGGNHNLRGEVLIPIADAWLHANAGAIRKGHQNFALK